MFFWKIRYRLTLEFDFYIYTTSAISIILFILFWDIFPIFLDNIPSWLGFLLISRSFSFTSPLTLLILVTSHKSWVKSHVSLDLHELNSIDVLRASFFYNYEYGRPPTFLNSSEWSTISVRNFLYLRSTPKKWHCLTWQLGLNCLRSLNVFIYDSCAPFNAQLMD